MMNQDPSLLMSSQKVFQYMDIRKCASFFVKIKKMKNILNILKILSIVFIIYGLIVISLIGTNRLFNLFYLISGITLLLFTMLYEKMDQRIAKALLIFLGIVFLCFILMEIRIISYAHSKPKKNADYLIVLGSQIKDTGPSMDYQARLDSAYEYLKENLNTKVICTGGQGYNEPMSEAKGGAEYLKKKGIKEDRIILEDKSKSTLENLTNAREPITKEKPLDEASVVIVSADYHLYRGAYIARKLGYKDVSVKGGHGLFVLLPHYYTREAFALIYELLRLK